MVSVIVGIHLHQAPIMTKCTGGAGSSMSTASIVNRRYWVRPPQAKYGHASDSWPAGQGALPSEASSKADLNTPKRARCYPGVVQALHRVRCHRLADWQLGAEVKRIVLVLSNQLP